jgi:hypothetical protein
VTEILTVAAPLDAEHLGWVSHLYGRADPKYRRTDVLEHLFTRTPEPSLHAFAVDDGPVGHCCVVPTPGRLGNDAFRCGKLEALFIEESHRGRRPDGRVVVGDLLSRLYAFADEHEIELIHALATHEIGRVIRFTPLDGVGERSFVSAIRARGPAAALASAQRTARAAGAARRPSFELREPTVADVDLVEASLPRPGSWAVLPADSWDWYCTSPLVRVLETPRSRVLVQLPGSEREPFRLVAWSGQDVREALDVVWAAGRVARSSGAPTLRFQPWDAPGGDGALARACRLTAFVPRDDLTRVWVRMRGNVPPRRDAAVSTPAFYLAF